MIKILKVLFKTTNHLIFGCLALAIIYFFALGIQYLIRSIMESDYRMPIIAFLWIMILGGFRFMWRYTSKNLK